jgi:hypothetical protein
VLHPRRLAFSVNATATLEAIRARDADVLEDEDLFHETMIAALTRRRQGTSRSSTAYTPPTAWRCSACCWSSVELALAAALAS